MLSIPLNRLRTVAEDIAEGDYSQRSDLHSQDEIGVLSETINVMAGKLQDTLAGLENTVEERTKELNQRAVEMEASQRVTFAASENTTPDDLLDLVTNLVRDVFDLYHAQVYLVDEKGENAVLRESTGYAGRQLLQKNHSIPLNQAALVTTAINSAEPVLVSDVSKDERHLANPLLPETRSELVTPLVIEGKVLGALDIQSREAGFFSERSIELFKSMSDQIALLFEKSQLLEQVTEQAESLIEFTEKLRAAAEVAEQLSPILDPEQLLSVGVVLLQSHFNLYHAHVYLLDDSKENLVMHTGSGRVGVLLRQQGHSIPLTHESSVVARAAREVHPVLISDTEKETAHLPNPLLPNTRSELALPLVVAGQVIGVLDLQDETPNHFTQIDTDTFTTLSGQIASSLQTARVFTEQQKTQAALKDSEAQFRILVENAPEAIVVVDVDTGKFIEGNENAEQLYGLRHDKLISVGPADVSPPIQPDGARSIDKAMKHLHQALQGEIPVFDWIHLNSDGEEIPCEVRLAHLPAAGRNLVRASVTNISERKQAQDAIVQSDRLKSEFLANMSHELRTPLNSIVGYTDVLLMGLDGELEEEKRLDVVAIQQNSNELLRIINDILDLAKIEAGRMIFELSEIDVKKLLHDVQKSNAGLLVNKPVEVRIEAEEGLPDITADEGRLTQVLNNLVSNAVKFTEEGTVTIRATQSGGYVQIDVEDTGVGISEEDLEVIFEQFRQADGSIARPEEGTGLGLAITRSLVNLHGGTIDVQSELGKGSIFTVRLPIDNHISPDVVIVNRDKTNGDSVRQTAPFLEQAVEQKANGDLPDLNAG